MNFSPIRFKDGTEYTSQEVQWIVEDYKSSAEQTLEKRRGAAKYQAELRGTYEKPEQGIAIIDERQAFIKRAKRANEYNWIVKVAKARGEIDLVDDLRIKLLSCQNNSFSAIEVMQDYIDKTLKDVENLGYLEMARIKFMMKTIEDLGKKWGKNDKQQVNVAVQNVINGAEQQTTTIGVNDIRSKVISSEASFQDAEFTEVKGTKE